jgi:hypothetical protein
VGPAPSCPPLTYDRFPGVLCASTGVMLFRPTRGALAFVYQMVHQVRTAPWAWEQHTANELLPPMITAGVLTVRLLPPAVAGNLVVLREALADDAMRRDAWYVTHVGWESGDGKLAALVAHTEWLGPVADGPDLVAETCAPPVWHVTPPHRVAAHSLLVLYDAAGGEVVRAPLWPDTATPVPVSVSRDPATYRVLSWHSYGGRAYVRHTGPCA